MQINGDQVPAASYLQSFRNTKRIKEASAWFQRHPSAEFTIRNIFNTFQLIAAGSCSYTATRIYNDPSRDPDAPIGGEFIVSTVIASVLLCIATATPIFRVCCNDNRTSFSRTPSAFLVFAATCLGIVIASKQQFNRATVQWNNISQYNEKIGYENEAQQNEFSQSINNCFDEILDNQKFFTLPDCYICDEAYDGSTRISSLPFHTSQIFQSQVLHFNQILCPPSTGVASIYWDDFTSMTFNETLGSWPCDPAWPSNANENEALEATGSVLSAMIGVVAPFSVKVEPIFNNSTGCVRALGFGIIQFNLQSLCGMNNEKYNQIPSIRLACFSDAARTFAVNYTKNYKGLANIPSASFPKELDSLVQGKNSKIPYILMGYLAIVSLALLSYREWLRSKKDPERQPLLLQAPAAV